MGELVPLYSVTVYNPSTGARYNGPAVRSVEHGLEWSRGYVTAHRTQPGTTVTIDRRVYMVNIERKLRALGGP